MVRSRLVSEQLIRWFEVARDCGFLGPAPIEGHIEQAERFWSAVDAPETVVDLGSGAGVPGLILASWWPDTRFLLVEGKEKRASRLHQVVSELGWDDRVEVRGERAESLAHEPELREQYALVVARSFGLPAVVAECGAGFVALGGCLAVSEPPGPERPAARADVEGRGIEERGQSGSRGPERPAARADVEGRGIEERGQSGFPELEVETRCRWPDGPLAELGLQRGRLESSIQILEKASTTPGRYPRRVGVPSKRPLF